MSLGGGLGVAGGLVSGIGSIFSSNAQQKAAGQAQSTYQQGYNTANQNQAGYTNAGNSAVSTLSNDLQNGTGFAASFDPSKYMDTAGYQFQLGQGLQAVNNGAAAQGGLLSGATQKGLAVYASGLANTTYNQAYQNYLQGSQQRYNQLAGVAGMGQSAEQNVNQQNSASTSGVANAQIGAGNAAASGIMGAANAAGGATSGLGQYYLGKQAGYY